MTETDQARAGVRRSRENRKLVSAPEFRTFLAIASLWRLSPKQRLQVLGSPSFSAYRRWVRQAHAIGSFRVSELVLRRISAVFVIHQALAALFETEDKAVEWLWGPHQAPPFDGRRPLELLADGTLDGLIAVRRFLDGACQGLYMPPNAVDADFSPYGDDEIIIKEGD